MCPHPPGATGPPARPLPSSGRPLYHPRSSRGRRRGGGRDSPLVNDLVGLAPPGPRQDVAGDPGDGSHRSVGLLLEVLIPDRILTRLFKVAHAVVGDDAQRGLRILPDELNASYERVLLVSLDLPIDPLLLAAALRVTSRTHFSNASRRILRYPSPRSFAVSSSFIASLFRPRPTLAQRLDAFLRDGHRLCPPGACDAQPDRGGPRASSGASGIVWERRPSRAEGSVGLISPRRRRRELAGPTVRSYRTRCLRDEPGEQEAVLLAERGRAGGQQAARAIDDDISGRALAAVGAREDPVAEEAAVAASIAAVADQDKARGSADAGPARNDDTSIGLDGDVVSA